MDEQWHEDRQRAQAVYEAGVSGWMSRRSPEQRLADYQEAEHARWELMRMVHGMDPQDRTPEHDALILRRMRRADALYNRLVTADIAPGSSDAAALWRSAYAQMRGDEAENPIIEASELEEDSRP